MLKTASPKVQDEFYKQIFRLTLPIVLQNLLSAAVNSADVLMLNYVGQSAIAAVSLASQYASILHMVYYGLGTGATILCAQYYGKGDMRAIETVEGIALRFSMLISFGFAALALFAPQGMMRLFTDDAELIAIGASYLRILSVSYLCCGVAEVHLSILRSVERVVVSTGLNTMTILLNVALNAVFIFGLFGVPKLGVIGVAVATSISRIVELVACFIVSAMSRDVKLKLSSVFYRNRLLLQDFVRLAVPALGNDIVWGVGFSMYSVIIGHMGSDAVAANSFVSVVRNLGTVLCYGVASGGGILVGKIIGRNCLEEAREGAKKVVRLTVWSGIAGGLIVLAVMPFALKYASLTDTAMHYLKYMMLINTYYIMGTALNTTLIAGIFRAGGDSKFGFYCDIFDMWCYAVPLGFIAAFVLKLPVLWVYFLICTDEFAKLPFVLKRYKGEKWLCNITRDGLFADEKPA